MFYSQQYFFDPQLNQNMMIPLYFPQEIYSPLFNGEIFFPNFQIFPTCPVQQDSTAIRFEEQSLKKDAIDNKTHSVIIQKQKKYYCQNSQDSEYVKPELKNQGQSVIYKNKNTETNLANQIFSFLASPKSSWIIGKLFGQNSQKIEQFYSLMLKNRKVNKKYLNRKDIINLITMDPKSPYNRCYLKSKISLEVQELKKVLRISVTYFLEESSRTVFLTSKKMNRQTLLQHLKRIRQFKQYLEKNLCPQSGV